MLDVTVSESLWATSMLPERYLERWRVADHVRMDVGQPNAEVRIEDELHEIVAPAAGMFDSRPTTKAPSSRELYSGNSKPGLGFG
jgi:hypothetical protein